MPTHCLKIEIFSAPSCTRCNKAFQLAERLIAELAEQKIENDAFNLEGITLRKLSVVDELDYAVDLGVRATPSIAMNGVLVFTAMPNAADFRKAILSHVDMETRTSHE
jgi:thioredoxin